MVPLRAVRATMPGEAEHTTGKVGGADGALAKGAFEMGKAGFFFFSRGRVAVPSTDAFFLFFSRLREPCFFLAIPGLLLFERPSGARADGVGCSDGGTVCDRFVIGL